jgi:hypothetical protein
MVDSIIIIQPSDKVIESKYIAQSTSDDYKAIYNSNLLNNNLPVVYGGSEECLRKVIPNKGIDDKNVREKGLKILMENNRTIACLDNEDTSFSIFNDRSEFVKQVFINTKSHIDGVKILDFCYSNSEN